MEYKVSTKKIFLLLAGGLSILTAGAQTGHIPFLQKTFPRESIRQVESHTSGGNISVYGEPSGQARVEVYISSNNGRRDSELSREEIQKRLDEEYELIISVNGDKLTATARSKERNNMNWRRGLSIGFKIYVPQAVSTSLRTSGGNINMKDLSGTEDFSTSGGNLDIDNLSGKVRGRTSGGNVSITGSKDDIDITTSGGNMDAEHCEGTIHLATSGGNINLRALKGTVNATTSGGHVEGESITGELRTGTSGGNIDLRDLSCSVRASTSGGNIYVTVKETGKYVDLSNSSGSINLEMPQGQGLDLKIYGERVHAGTLNNFHGAMDEKHIDGTLNGGGIPVKVDGNSGNVHLTFR
jgi:DUF4097 and DUF4098 domain-containing protein YvlB